MGGKLHVFASSLPKVGTKALVVRDAGGRTNEREPLKLMEPASKEYRELAESAADGMVRSPGPHPPAPCCVLTGSQNPGCTRQKQAPVHGTCWAPKVVC